MAEQKASIFQKMANLSKWRFGLNLEVKNFGSFLLCCGCWILNIFWYIALAVLWVLASIFWLIILLPGKGLAKQFKARSKRIDVDIYASHKRPKD